MKKYLLIIALVFLSMSVIISCDNANKTPESSNSEEKPSTPEDNPTTPAISEIVLLDLADVVSSRGITKFPDDSPFFSIDGASDTSVPPSYGFWMNCNVMRSLPVFPGLTSVNANAKAYVNSIKGKRLKGYGFTLTVRIAEETDDGVFISYDIADGFGHTSGTIEYYYSIKEKKFSYREIVMPLFGNIGGDQIFVFEMLNVPVEKVGNSFSFKAGELYENGSSFNHISFFNGSYSPLGPVDESNIETLQFEDAKIVMNYQGDNVCSMEYEKYYLNGENSVRLEDLIDLESPLSLDEENRKNYSMRHILYFLRNIYEDTFEKRGFSTIEDFNATKLNIKEDKKTVLYKNVENHKFYGLAFPLSYNLNVNKNIGACLYNNNGTVKETHFNPSGHGASSFPPFVLEQFKKCFGISEEITNFDQFVSLMFKNLGLTEYAESVELRKSLLSDSYN